MHRKLPTHNSNSLPGKLLKQSIARTVWEPPWEARVIYILWSCYRGDGQMETLFRGDIGAAMVTVMYLPISGQQIWNVQVWLESAKGSIHRV